MKQLTIQEVARKGGKNGTGASKRRGDSTYYSELAKKRKKKSTVPKELTLYCFWDTVDSELCITVSDKNGRLFYKEDILGDWEDEDDVRQTCREVIQNKFEVVDIIISS